MISDSQPAVLQAVRVVKRFAIGRRVFGKPSGSWLHAVDDVTLSIGAGESVGLVGESGCGKSTLVRLLSRLLDADEGRIEFEGLDLARIRAARFARHPLRAKIQVVFQDPTDSLNPRYTAFDSIAEPLRLLADVRDAATLHQRVVEAAAEVGLPEPLLARFPHQLSGGQKARVNIARAIAVRPRLLVLDEPTAALDVSVQAIVLDLLASLRQRLQLSYLFVSHDLNVIRLMCDRVLVMYLGRVVEAGPATRVFASPAHPYTRLLVAALPRFGRHGRDVPIAQGEPSSPIDPDPKQCRFASRCPQVMPRCTQSAPPLTQIAVLHEAACHFPLAASDDAQASRELAIPSPLEPPGPSARGETP